MARIRKAETPDPTARLGSRLNPRKIEPVEEEEYEEDEQYEEEVKKEVKKKLPPMPTPPQPEIPFSSLNTDAKLELIYQAIRNLEE